MAAFGRCAFGGRLFVFGGRGLGFLAVARVPSIIRTFWRVAEIKMTFVGFVAESMQIQIRLNRDPQEIFRCLGPRFSVGLVRVLVRSNPGGGLRFQPR